MVLPKTFFQRLKSTFVFYQSRYIFEKITHVQTEAMRKYLSSDIPNIREIEKTVSLMFVNSHHTLFAIRPNTPAVIPIAGIHIEENDDELSLVSFHICFFDILFFALKIFSIIFFFYSKRN